MTFMNILPVTILTWAIVFILCTVAPVEASIQLQFDYTYDSSGFFDAVIPEGALAKSTLEAVGDFYASILDDDLLAIDPDYGLTGYTFQPDTLGSGLYIPNLDVPADAVIVYVGAYNFDGNILGQAGPGIYSQPVFDAAMARGEGSRRDMIGPKATEFAPWGGAMGIDSDTNWNLDYTADPAGDEIDLYSVIVHEIGHVLGMGIADSWDNLIRGTQFSGVAAVAEHGGPVAVTEDGSHWAAGTTSTVFAGYASQDASMTPYISWGTRKLFTALDVAGLDDIGWDIHYLPGAHGDANLDDKVDDIDATIMATNWLRSDATWSQGDFNGDGTVDDEDAALMATNWQTGSGSAAASVPEPSVAALLLLALAAVVILRRRLANGPAC